MTDFNVMEGGAPSEEERECQRDKEWAKMKSSGPPAIQPPTCFALSKSREAP